MSRRLKRARARQRLVVQWVIATLAICGAIAVSCASSQVARPPPQHAPVPSVAGEHEARPNPGAARGGSYDAALVERHCPFGIPDPKWDHGKTQVIARGSYALEHSASAKVPLWVCERLSRDEVHGDTKRSNHFLPDPSLPVGERAELEDYAKSGYDRGHLAAAADHRHDAKAMEETFFLSNMAPQNSELNRGLWKHLEEYVRRIVDQQGSLGVITGPLLSRDPLATIGAHHVAVPKMFYKVLVSDSNAIAFVVDNVPHAESESLKPYVRSVDSIEDESGYDVMPRLSADDEARLERRPAHFWNAR